MSTTQPLSSPSENEMFPTSGDGAGTLPPISQPTLISGHSFDGITDAQIDQDAFRESAAHDGRAEALEPHLNDLINSKLRYQPSPDELAQLSREVAHAESMRDFEKKEKEAKRTQRIPARKAKIAERKQFIHDYRANPENHEHVVDPAQYRFTSVILAFLTTYLCVFYTSASYMAFLWSPASELIVALTNGQADMSVVFPSVFKPNTIRLVLQDGVFGLFYILLVSAVFLGFGLALDWFSKIESMGKRLISWGGLGIAVFLFDAIIAGAIDAKIIAIKVLTGMSDEAWTLAESLSSLEFWSVLAGGFLVSVVWGIAFNIWLILRRQMNVTKEAAAEIKTAEKEITQIEVEAEQHEKNEHAYDAVIRKKIRRMQHPAPPTDYLIGKVNIAVGGWTRYIESTRLNVPARISACQAVKAAFVADLKAQSTPLD